MTLQDRNFVRIFSDEDIPVAVQTILQTWNIGFPDLLVTFVTGKTDSSFWRPPDQRAAFQVAIRKLVSTGVVLLIDNGLDYGVSTLVGSAAQEQLSHEDEQTRPQIGLIGIVPTSQYAGTSRPDLTAVKSDSEPTYDLEKNHKHLIYINQPYSRVGANQFDLESLLRFKLGKSLIEKNEDPANTSRVHPSSYVSQVVVFAQGFTVELNQIATYLENDIPVVVLDGCGGTADVLATAITCWKGIDNTVFRDTVAEKIRKVYGRSKLRLTEETQEYITDKIIDVLYLSHNENLLKRVDVNNLDTLASLDLLIYSAVIEHTPKVVDHHLLKRNWNLAIHSNQLDYGTLILSQSQWKEMKIPRAVLMEAIISRDREPFVDLILQQFPIRTFMTHLDFLALFQRTIDNTFFKENVWDQVLQHHAETPITENFLFLELNGLIYSLTKTDKYLNFVQMSANALGLGTQDPVIQDQMTLHAMIVYAALFNRVELLKVLLKYCIDPIPQALFVETIFRGLSRYNRDLPDLYRDLKAIATVFDKLAADLFQLGHQDSPDRCVSMLTRKLPEFHDKTALHLAYEAYSLNFIYHPAMRQFIEDYAYGFIQKRGEFGCLKLVTSALCIFPAYMWLTFPRLGERADLDKLALQDQENADPVVSQAIGASPLEGHKDPPIIHRRPPLTAMLKNIWSTPTVKFWIWFATYHLFLVLIGVSIMLPPCMYAGVDVAVFVFTCGFLVDLLLRTICDLLYARPFPKHRRIFDLIFPTVFNVLFFLYRIAPYRETYPFTGRVVFGFGVLYYYYSVWDQFLKFSTYTGGAISLLSRNMLFDLTRWTMLMVPLVIPTSVVWQAMITPDWPSSTGDDWRHAFYRGVFTIFGGFSYELEYETSYCEPTRKIVWSNFSQPLDASPHDRCWLGDYDDYNCATVSTWGYIFVTHYYFVLRLTMLFVLATYYWMTNTRLRKLAPLVWTYNRFESVMTYAARSALPWPFSIIGYIVSIVTYKKSKRSELITIKEVTQLISDTDMEAFTYWRAKIMKHFGRTSQAADVKEAVEIQHKKLLDIAEVVSLLQTELKILTSKG